MKKRKQDPKQNTGGGQISIWSQRVRIVGLRASSATGLAGLPESHYLSCFLEQGAPM